LRGYLSRDLAVGVEKDVGGLDIFLDDVLAVDIPHGATQLGDPEPADGPSCPSLRIEALGVAVGS
jgi:hypothetical protein